MVSRLLSVTTYYFLLTTAAILGDLYASPTNKLRSNNNNNDDIACANGCEDLPGIDYLNHDVMNTDDNCEATQKACDLALKYLDQADTSCVISDYDGSETSEENKLFITQDVIEQYNLDMSAFSGAENAGDNRYSFFYYIALMEALGYNTGFNIGGNTAADRANNFAARTTDCIEKDWDSDEHKYQIKYGWCINDSMTGLARAQQLQLVYGFFSVFPEFQVEYSFWRNIANFYATQGYRVIVESGSPNIFKIAQALLKPGVANNAYTSDACMSSDNTCPIIANTASYSIDGISTITPNTANICDGIEYSQDTTDVCVSHKEGKVSGYDTAQQRWQCKNIMLANLNSDNDEDVGNKVLKNDGSVFSNDNKDLCKTLDSKDCFDIENPKSEREISVTITQETMDNIANLAGEILKLPKRLDHKSPFSLTTKQVMAPFTATSNTMFPFNKYKQNNLANQTELNKQIFNL